MWNHLVGVLGTVPPGFPEQIEMPQPFLSQINTTFWIWFIRIALIAGLVICLFYAHSASDDLHSSFSEEKSHDPDDTQIDEEKVTK